MSFRRNTLCSSTLAALMMAGLATAQMTPPAPAPDASTTVKDKLTPKDKMMMLDVDQDGLISREEADSSISKDWKLWDSNNDGVIDATEFAAGSKASPKGGKKDKY